MKETAAPATATTLHSPITEILSELGSVIDDVELAFDALRTRIDSILTPEVPSEAEKGPVVMGGGQLREVLQLHVNRLRKLQRGIIQTQGNVEL